MSKNNVRITLAMLEALAGHAIERRPQQPERQSKKIIYPKIGTSNKICTGCGHKNKKCTCKEKV